MGSTRQWEGAGFVVVRISDPGLLTGPLQSGNQITKRRKKKKIPKKETRKGDPKAADAGGSGAQPGTG